MIAITIVLLEEKHGTTEHREGKKQNINKPKPIKKRKESKLEKKTNDLNDTASKSQRASNMNAYEPEYVC